MTIFINLKAHFIEMRLVLRRESVDLPISSVQAVKPLGKPVQTFETGSVIVTTVPFRELSSCHHDVATCAGNTHLLESSARDSSRARYRIQRLHSCLPFLMFFEIQHQTETKAPFLLKLIKIVRNTSMKYTQKTLEMSI